MIPIVVIDSSPDFADLIRQVLAETGQYEILSAHTANEGLDIIQEGYVRLAIVDFDLPDVNGAELVVEMRTVYPSLAVIAIPLSNTVDSPELEGLPIEGVLTKPFFPPHLPKIISEALAQVGVEQEMAETSELVDPSQIVTAKFDEDALIDEIQDLFEDQDFAPTEYPSQFDIEAELSQTGELGPKPGYEIPPTPEPSHEPQTEGTSPFFVEPEPEPEPEHVLEPEPMTPSEEDTQEHKVVRADRPSPFAAGDGWVDMGDAVVDHTAETSELKHDDIPVEAQDEWFSAESALREEVPAAPEAEIKAVPLAEPEAELTAEPMVEPEIEPPAVPIEEPEIEAPPEIPDSLRMGTREFASRLDVLRQSAPDAMAAAEAEEDVDEEEEAFPQDAPSFDELVTSSQEEPEGLSLPESSPLVEEGMTWVEMMAAQTDSLEESAAETPEQDEMAETEGEEWFETDSVEMETGTPEWIEPQEPVTKPETHAAPMEWLPDQIEKVRQEQPVASVEEPQVEAETVEAPPPWLEDVDRAAQYLTRLSLETSAVAALLTRGPDVWAYAGELTQAQVQALTSLIAEFWDTEGASTAIARFISLPEADNDFMFYGTHVAGGIVLSLVFSAETPFGMIRRQAQSLARTLSEIDPSDHVPQPVAEVEKVEEAEEELPEFEFESQDFKLTQDPSIFFSDLDLPSPDPEDKAKAEDEAQQPGPESEPTPEPASVPIPSDWRPDRSQRTDHLAYLDEQEQDAQPTIEETLPTPAVKASGGPLPRSEVDISFSMVLVPRFPEHRLTGRLAENLHRWIERLCLAWDWRADNIEILPAFTAVTLTIPPDVAPSNVVTQLRDDLSARVMEEFPEMAHDLPSGRFWARGFLLKAGGRPKDEHIQAFILQTRRAQGLAS
jgi:CheY-like chemotaxis protein/REP element-mobilizing transposase RayT